MPTELETRDVSIEYRTLQGHIGPSHQGRDQKFVELMRGTPVW